MSDHFNPDRPFGKGATIVTKDNIDASQDALQARRRIERGEGRPGDRELLDGREAFIKNARQMFELDLKD